VSSRISGVSPELRGPEVMMEFCKGGFPRIAALRAHCSERPLPSLTPSVLHYVALSTNVSIGAGTGHFPRSSSRSGLV